MAGRQMLFKPTHKYHSQGGTSTMGKTSLEDVIGVPASNYSPEW